MTPSISPLLPPAIRNSAQERAEKNPLSRVFLQPARIVWHNEGVENAKALLDVKDPQIALAGNTGRGAVLQSKAGPASILIDFGFEFHGSVKLYILSATPNRVRLRYRFGESAGEAMAELGGTTGATNDHITRDGVIEVGMLSMQEIGPSGFRFVRLDLLGQDASERAAGSEGAQIELVAVKGIMTYRELEYKGSFHSDDPLIDRIWAVGAYTVQLCMQEYIWDGIKRDRLVWIGDMDPEVATILTVFGDPDCVPNSLDFAKSDAPLPAWMNNVPSYSVWWVLIQYRWFLQNGNYGYLKAQEEYLTGLVPLLCGFVGDDGREQIPDWRFLDWPTNDKPAAKHAGLQGLLTMGLDALGFLLQALGRGKESDRCHRAVARLKTHCPDPCGHKPAAALLAMAGILPYEKADRDVLSQNGAHGLSTFLGSYALAAQALAGNMNGALDNVRAYWGGMLSRGATTFWEDFDIDWLDGSGSIDELTPSGLKDLHGDYGAYCYKGYRHSLCHGWASGVTAFLSNYVLGIRPLAPGCTKIVVAPMLGGLREVSGTYPTPYGLMTVEHKRNTSGNVLSKLTIPRETTAVWEGTQAEVIVY